MNEYKIKKRKKCARTLGNMEKGKGEGAHTQRGNENTWWGVKRIIHRTGTSALCRPSFWKIIIKQIVDLYEAKMRKYCSSIAPLYHNLHHHHHHIYLKPRWNTRTRFWNITSNTRKLMKARGRRPSAFIVFEFLKLLLQQKKISLNNHLNKFSQFSYYIWDVKYAWTSKKCVWCTWSYPLIAALWQFLNIQQLGSRYLAVCQFRANMLLRNANGSVQI